MKVHRKGFASNLLKYAMKSRSPCSRTSTETNEREHAEPTLDLVEPRAVLRRVDEPYAVGFVDEERSAARDVLEDAALALDAEVDAEPITLGHEPHEGFGDVGREIVDDKHPTRLCVHGDRPQNVKRDLPPCESVRETAR